MMHVFYNEAGNVISTFTGDIALLNHASGNSIEVTQSEEELGEIADWRVEDGVLRRVGVSNVCRSAIIEANTMVGVARLRHITAIPGQDALYQAKLEEARAYLALATEPSTLYEYPLLEGEVGLTAPDAYSLAQLWLNMNVMWSYHAAQLEKIRLRAIDNIQKASTVGEVDHELQTLKTALLNFT